MPLATLVLVLVLVLVVEMLLVLLVLDDVDTCVGATNTAGGAR